MYLEVKIHDVIQELVKSIHTSRFAGDRS